LPYLSLDVIVITHSIREELTTQIGVKRRKNSLATLATASVDVQSLNWAQTPTQREILIL